MLGTVMRSLCLRGRAAGLTLIELLVVMAVVGVVLVLAAPSMREVLEMQRLRGVAAQFLTDVQFTRAEAASRQEITGISFRSVSGVSTCYIVYTCGTSPRNLSGDPPDSNRCSCNCNLAEGSRCTAPRREIRTVTIPADSKVLLAPEVVSGSAPSSTQLYFDPVTGAMSTFFPLSAVTYAIPPNGAFWVRATLMRPESSPALRTEINIAGRPRNCAPTVTVSGVEPC